LRTDLLAVPAEDVGDRLAAGSPSRFSALLKPTTISGTRVRRVWGVRSLRTGVSDGGNKRVVSSGGGAEPRWRADGRELFYVSADRRLVAVPTTSGPAFEAGKPQVLFEMNIRDLVTFYLKRYEVTPDGQRFVVEELMTGGSPSPLTVVVNWPALLPKSHWKSL
jgi:hypothetical protein